MSHVLDERIEYAIEQLWLNPIEGDGNKAKAMLEEAANEGNGDACFFLGRCYLGECFVHPRFGFEEDFDKGMEYFNKSISLGSAIGMFGTRRLSGFQPIGDTYIHPPYNSNREIWDAVKDLAEKGQVFCQYMLGNAYYYGDCIEMMEIPDEEVNNALIQAFQNKAIELFQKSIDNGLTMAISNLIDIITSGDYGIPVDQKRADQLKKRGAELNEAYYECEYAKMLHDDNLEEAVQYYERSIAHGCPNAYFPLGKLYAKGDKIPQDTKKAITYFEKGIESQTHWRGCMNQLGELYFHGRNDLAPDYEKAFSLFSKVIDENDWCSDMLGHCYLKGLGTEVDYEAARKHFLVYPKEELSAIGLGEIYCFGLGVKQNIAEGMNYLNKFPDHPRVAEIKSHFKRTLFGWKQIK